MQEALCALQVSHGAIQFMVYEELKALAAGAGEYAKDTGRSSLSAFQISLMGAASKLVASAVTYPSQVGSRVSLELLLHGGSLQGQAAVRGRSALQVSDGGTAFELGPSAVRCPSHVCTLLEQKQAGPGLDDMQS